MRFGSECENMELVHIPSICLLLLLLLIPIKTRAEKLTPNEYWTQIRKTAANEFSGIELNPVIKTGYQFSGENEGPNINFQFDLPLWNKKQRFEKREQATKFLQTGAKLVKKLETCINTLSLWKEKSRFLKAMIQTEGVTSVKIFFETEKDIIEQQALETQLHRELQGLINPTSSVVKIYSVPNK